jgi:indole-3-glycerol phosphate synthase
MNSMNDFVPDGVTVLSVAYGGSAISFHLLIVRLLTEERLTSVVELLE